MMKNIARLWEWLVESVIRTAGVLAVVFVLLIFAFLLRDALPVFTQRSLADLLAGDQWRPTSEPAQFGMLALIVGSVYVTAGALALSVPLGLGCAVFIAEVAPDNVRELLKPTVEMLAAIPSVVYGFLGLLVIGPWLKDLLGLLVAQFAALGSLMLALMATPTTVSVSEDAIRTVPLALRDSSLALGATRWQTIIRVTLPAARSGIIAACLLGLGRAIGETMTVLMVTGNAPIVPSGLAGFLRPVRTMTATIAAEMGESAHGSVHYHALFAVGLILFVITFVTNTIADRVVRGAGGVKT